MVLCSLSSIFWPQFQAHPGCLRIIVERLTGTRQGGLLVPAVGRRTIDKHANILGQNSFGANWDEPDWSLGQTAFSPFALLKKGAGMVIVLFFWEPEKEGL